MPIRRWLWFSYLRTAVIPLLVIELTFLAVYWGSNSLVYNDNISAIKQSSQVYLGDVARREAATAALQLQVVTRVTGLFAQQATRALDGDYLPPPAERARYARTGDGAFYTRFDNGTTASFYSGVSPVRDAQVRKAWRLAALDPLMMDIKKTYPLARLIHQGAPEGLAGVA